MMTVIIIIMIIKVTMIESGQEDNIILTWCLFSGRHRDNDHIQLPVSYGRQLVIIIIRITWQGTRGYHWVREKSSDQLSDFFARLLDRCSCAPFPFHRWNYGNDYCDDDNYDDGDNMTVLWWHAFHRFHSISDTNDDNHEYPGNSDIFGNFLVIFHKSQPDENKVADEESNSSTSCFQSLTLF